MQPIAAFKSCLWQYATFSGRAARSEFWFFVLLKFVAIYALSTVAGIVSVFITMSRVGFPPSAPGPLPTAHPAVTVYQSIPILILTLALLLPSIAVEVRRLHDLERSGWWWWLNLAPIVGPLWLLYWNCSAGTRGTNRFGPDPLRESGRGAMMEPIDAVKSCLSKFVTFKGRAPRAEYWFFMLFCTVVNWLVATVVIIVGAVALIPAGMFGPHPHPNATAVLVTVAVLVIGFVIAVVLSVPSIAVGVRRLHDIGRSGWWYWLYYIPLVGFVLMLVWGCERGTIGFNRFGPDPLR